MEQVLPFLVKVTGAGIKIVPLFLVVVVIYGFAQAGGKLTSWATGIKGNGLRKKAQDYRDYRENVRKGEALSGQRGFGLGKYQRQARRELRNQAADAGAKSGQAQFGVSDKTAKRYTQAISQSNAQINAINAANNNRFATGVAQGGIDVRSGMNSKVATDDEVKKAINAQQERAIAEAIKDVELSATFTPGALGEVGDALKKAIDEGDGISARAYQNMLLKSGSKGQEVYRDTMEQVTPGDMAPGTKSASAVNSLKQNLLLNHGGVKETAADLVAHAVSPGATMQQASNSTSTWKMADEDLVKQKTHSLKKAAAAGGISLEQATAIRDDPQLFRRLDPDGQKVITNIAGPRPTP